MPGKNNDNVPVKHSPAYPWVLVVVFFLLIGSFLFLRSPVFLVKNYVVTGINRVSYDEIVARSTQRSGNIFDLRLDKIQAAIETSPWVEKAECSRKLPDTLVISITERKPVVFAPIGDSFWLVDNEGRVLEKDDHMADNLIALTGVKEMVSPGYFLDEGTYRWAFVVISHLGQLSKSKVIEVNINDGDCTLVLNDGCKVFVGYEQMDFEISLSLLESILDELEQDAKLAEYIDLRFDKQAVKLR